MSRHDGKKSRGGNTKVGETIPRLMRKPQASAEQAAVELGRSDFGLTVNQSNHLSLQANYGNAAVEQALVQRKPEGEAVAGVTETQTQPQASPDAATTPAPALIVEDDAETLEPGQMRRSDFLARLRAAVCATTAEALADTQWSEAGCPYIDQWFAYYSGQSGAYIERALRKYAPEAGGATTASGYIPIVSERVRGAVTRWVTTGEISGVPEGPPMGLPGTGALGAVAGVVSTVAGAVSGVVSGVGKTLSAVGSLLFKGREGGAREADDPQAIQSQLGAGQSLDSGVRSRMEGAFGESFSGVEVHTDGNAAEVSSNLNARALTVGEHVAFGAGEYQPGTTVGDALIAHELAHVMQQRGGGKADAVQNNKDGDHGILEEDADRMAVGAVLSLRGSRKVSSNLAGRMLPTLRSRLRLQRCDSKKKVPTQQPTLTPIPPPKTGQSYEEWLKTFSEFAGSERRDITSAAPADLKDLIVNKLGAPPDCADVSLLLRHYYLKSQDKTLTFKAGPQKKEFKIGAGVTDEQFRVCMIQLGSINFQEDRPGFRLTKYYKKAGTMIHNLKGLVDAGLKPGDLLIWKRLPSQPQGFEGHVQTVQAIDVSKGLLTVAQGNMQQDQGVAQLQQKQYTFKDLTGVEDGNADIRDTDEESFFGAGSWM